jgi:hypothetical protein
VSQLGRILMFVGAALIVLGAAFTIGSRFGLGRLPGDLVVERKGFTLYAPIVTSILISLLLTLVLNLFLRRR